MSLTPNYYPNLELLEYKVRQILSKLSVFQAAYEKAKAENKYARPNFEAYMFPQTWPSTALGFDAPGTVGGQALTSAYTTVFYEVLTNIYVVCFGGDVCYTVDHATEAFAADLAAHEMASMTMAKKLY